MITELHDRLLRDSFGCWPSGVTALCAMVDGELVGIAASSFTSVSLQPALVSVCGAVLIDGAVGTLECALEMEVPAGDHLIAVFRIEALAFDAAVAALVFHTSRYRRLAQ